MEVVIPFIFIAVPIITSLIVLGTWLSRKNAAAREAIQETVKRSGQPVVIPPEPTNFQGAKKTYGKVKGNGYIALTESGLYFTPLIGKAFEIPRTRIKGVREAKWFLGSAKGGRMVFVIVLDDENEVGFFLQDPAKWRSALV